MSLLRSLACSALVASVSHAAFATAHPPTRSTNVATAVRLGQGGNVELWFAALLNDTYRIGDEWGKREVTLDAMAQDALLERMSKATARIGGATGFYLGEFNGKYLFATNHHVCPTSCKGSVARFPWVSVNATVEDFYGTWPEVDLAIMTLTLDAAQAAKLAPYAQAFDFDARIYPGQTLLTVGFGVADNPMRLMVANQDSDCKVFSGDNEFRLMADPDQLNPGPYKAWSFANGCDVSHGDSGSAMVDRQTGKVVGIIWTGKIPKNARAQSSQNLADMFATRSADIWTELSYSVPAPKMAEFLRSEITAQRIDARYVPTLEALLGN